MSFPRKRESRMSKANAVLWPLTWRVRWLLTSGPVGGAEKRRLKGGCARGLSERSEFRSAPLSRASQGSDAKRHHRIGSPFFCLLFFGEAKKSKSPQAKPTLKANARQAERIGAIKTRCLKTCPASLPNFLKRRAELHSLWTLNIEVASNIFFYSPNQSIFGLMSEPVRFEKYKIFAGHSH